MRKFLLAFLLICSLGFTKEKKHYLSVCAVFHNESKFLKEWIEYHLLVGVDHFYLYNNSSNDRYTDILRPYLRKGVVSLVQWPNFALSPIEAESFQGALCSQVAAYENAIKLKGKEYFF